MPPKKKAEPEAPSKPVNEAYSPDNNHSKNVGGAGGANVIVTHLDTRPANVIEALARVMGDLPGISREMVSNQGYNYRGIEQITKEVQKLFGKYTVVMVPHCLERKTRDLTINGKPWTQEELMVSYTAYGPGGVEDCIEIGPVPGLGRDNSDKGANKAMTQAFKYALIQALCVADAKDDADQHEAAVADAPAPELTPEQVAEAQGWEDLEEKEFAAAAYAPMFEQLNDEQKNTLKKWRAKHNLTPGWKSTWFALMGFIALGCDPDLKLKDAIHMGETGEPPKSFQGAPKAETATSGSKPAKSAQSGSQEGETTETVAAEDTERENAGDAAQESTDEDQGRPFA